jgi:DNA-binding transcriptional LysR family regulator
MELGSQEAIKRVVMAGRGIGMVSRAGSEPELSAGLIAVSGLANLSSPLRLHVIYRKQKTLTLAQRAFL